MSATYVVFAMFVKATDENRSRSLDEWALLARIKNPRRFPEDKRFSGLPLLDNLYGEWTVADLWCQCCVEDLGDYLCFEIFTHMSGVSDYGLPPYKEIPGVTWEEQRAIHREKPSFYEDPRVQIAEEFGCACAALDAEVGVYAMGEGYKPGYMEIQGWLKEFVYDPGVRVGDARALFSSDTKIFFLNDAWDKELHRVHPQAFVEDQQYVFDEPSGRKGVLLFNGSGYYRF